MARQFVLSFECHGTNVTRERFAVTVNRLVTFQMILFTERFTAHIANTQVRVVTNRIGRTARVFM